MLLFPTKYQPDLDKDPSSVHTICVRMTANPVGGPLVIVIFTPISCTQLTRMNLWAYSWVVYTSIGMVIGLQSIWGPPSRLSKPIAGLRVRGVAQMQGGDVHLAAA